MGLWFDFNHSSGEGMSWMQWERKLAQRQQRAEALDGLCVEVHTLATMTPYDPSAGGTRPIMVYLQGGWRGSRAAMRPRWVGGLGWRVKAAKPFWDHMTKINYWIMFGSGWTLPSDTSYDIWKSMADWVENNLFGMRVPPKEQWARWRRGEGGAYGSGGNVEPEIINPWERVPAEADVVKMEASRPADYRREAFADVYASRGPGFLESMRRVGPVVRKGA